ncbi:MAG: hypothetical protein NC400_08975 [Clostridium sp.]|nr:hypothetical protein [Clostridium sp.]
MNLIKKLLNWKKQNDEPVYEIEDWNEVVYDRDDLKINNKEQRQEYVRGCLEQIAEAEKELENLQFEYNMVTSYLQDMEEIEALPEEERAILEECARKIDTLEKQQSGYSERSGKMNDESYRRMERLEEEVQEGHKKLSEAEERQDLIKRDLRRLDGEKQAYLFRRGELRRLISDTRTMTVICTAAVLACIFVLFILQYGFHMNTKLGYLAAAGAGAVAITVIFIKHNDAVSELARVESGITRIIRLQNTVKIRYVNNTNLLDYLYLKYNVSSAGELDKSWQQYQKEKEERLNYQQAVKQLDRYQKDLLHVLRRYQVKDPMVWLHQTAAILDKKEMVEIRHNLIIRRQSLRRRMDYNKEVIAGNAQAEVKDLVESYPKYAKEILNIVEEYEEDFS